MIEEKAKGLSQVTQSESAALEKVCYRHPNIETGLRCNKCERYICTKCATRTPVGYTCPECIRSHQNRFFTGGLGDYAIAVIIAFPLSLIVAGIFSLLIARIGFFSWIIAFVAAPIAGGLIAEAVRWGVQKRRSRHLARIVAACLVVAVLPFLLLHLFAGNMFGLIVPGILLFAGVGTIMARLH
jgi:hypothetical protein